MTTTAYADFCFDCAGSADQRIPEPPWPNPWPQLVRQDKLSYLRCQPLVRLVFTPKPLSDHLGVVAEQPLTRDRAVEVSRVRDRFNLWHEYSHFFLLDRTPAKELAKAYLAYAYDCCGWLARATSDREIEAAWRGFQKANKRLDQVLVSIRHSEEILATAFASATMEQDVSPGGKRAHLAEAFRDVREMALQAHEKREDAPSFRQTYEAIEPIVAGMIRDAELFNLVFPLLQPVRWRDDELEAVDATHHLLDVVDVFRTARTRAALVAEVRALREPFESSWKLAVHLEIENARELDITRRDQVFGYGRFAAALLAVSRGDKVYEHSLGRDALTGLSIDGGPSGIMTLNLDVRRRRTKLVPWMLFTNERDDEPGVRAAYSSLAHFEAIREQLLCGQGISCPENPSGLRTCQCRANGVRAAIYRLAELAEARYFGPGNWHKPTCALPAGSRQRKRSDAAEE